MKPLILAILLSSGADLASTCAAFKHGNFTEGHGPAAWVGDSCGKAAIVGVGGAAAKIFIVKKLEGAGHEKIARWIGIGFTVSSSGAAITNTIKIGRGK